MPLIMPGTVPLLLTVPQKMTGQMQIASLESFGLWQLLGILLFNQTDRTFFQKAFICCRACWWESCCENVVRSLTFRCFLGFRPSDRENRQMLFCWLAGGVVALFLRALLRIGGLLDPIPTSFFFLVVISLSLSAESVRDDAQIETNVYL